MPRRRSKLPRRPVMKEELSDSIAGIEAKSALREAVGEKEHNDSIDAT